MRILFLHGLESGPYGSKYQALNKIFGDVLAPDCTGISDASERLRVIQQAIKSETEPFLVVGSSMGGLMALLLQENSPEVVAGMVLCAPALHQPMAKDLNAEGLPPTTIIHGIHDDVVPIDVSRNFGVKLVEANDDHRLSRSLPLILREVFDLKLNLVFDD